MTFDSLGLNAALLRAITDQGYTEPTPIQQQAIPAILAGRDILAGAQTGTGKTAGFTLPLLQQLNRHPHERNHRHVRALIVTPTRELAAQVDESVTAYGRHLPLRSTVIFGGVKIGPQVQRLRQGVDIIVATPGRLLDHISQGNIDLSKIEILVLDEADRMLDMGFIHDIRRIIKLVPKKRQTLLFSATFSNEIRRLSEGLLHNPENIDVAPRNTTAERISQIVHPVAKSSKRALLSFLIGSNNWRQVLVFTRTKHGANRLAQQLERDGLTSAAIHGNKSQGARTRALAEFKSGKVRVLVATDIAARGLDIELLPHVVNYELPNVPEDYVHRIGRTGRAGSDGVAVSLVSPDEKGLLHGIERLLGKPLPRKLIDGYEQATATDETDADSHRQGRPAGRSGQQRNTQQRNTQQRNNQQRNGQPRQRRADANDNNSNRPGNQTSAGGESESENSGNRRSNARPQRNKTGGTSGRSSSPYGQGSNSSKQVNGNRRTSAGRRNQGAEVPALFGG
jgi:ATP-dependent RNA helicase RhlE